MLHWQWQRFLLQIFREKEPYNYCIKKSSVTHSSSFQFRFYQSEEMGNTINFAILETDKANYNASFYWIDKSISINNFSLDGAIMPLYAHLFAIRNRSNKKIWPYKRRLAYHKKSAALSSMGRPWTRSGSIIFY
jgi:hypothetical protein